MPDVFDTLDAPKSDIFDSLGTPRADIFDSLSEPPRSPAQDYMPVGMSAQDEASAIEAAPQWMQNAGTAAAETASDFIPRDLHSAASLVNPLLPAIEQGKTAYKIGRDTINGKPFMEALNEHDALARQMTEAERTPPYSKERFGAGLNVLAQLGMAYVGAKGAMAHMGEPAASKGTVEAPTAPPERPGEPAAPETPAPARTEAEVKADADAILAQRDAEVQAEHSARIQQQAQDAIPTTSDNTRAALDWRKELMQEQVALAKSAKLETAIAGRPTPYTERRLGEIDAELRRGYQPPQPEQPLQQAPEPAKIPTRDEFTPEQEPRPGDTAVVQPAGQQRAASEPVAGVDAGQAPQNGGTQRPDSIGVAERYVEEQQPGTVVPGTRENAAHWRAKGADYINAGGDPRMPIRAAGAGHTSPYNVGIVSAEYARLEQLRRNAGAALEERPQDPALQKQYSETAQATQAWRREMQSVLTKAGESLAAIQGEMPVDLSTFDGLHAKAMELNGGHELTPGQKAQLMKRAGTAKKIKAYETDAAARRDAVIEKTLPKVKAPTEADMAAMVDKMVKRMTPCR